MNKKLLSLIISVCALIGTILATCGVNDDDGSLLQVHYIDVGQGDSIYIEFPEGKTMLIDAGENGEETVRYVKNQGAKRIDFLVGTHPHSDHIGGLEKVIESFEIGEIYMPRVTNTSKTFEDLLLAIDKKGKTINGAKAGKNIYKNEDLLVDILAPVKDEYENLNNYSIVIKITYKNKSFLFTGDAENEALEMIKGDVSADVLKVAHHGSNTSDSKGFIKRVSPDYAVISVGSDNSYGHPHKRILSLLKSVDADILRTDEYGTIVVKTDGNEIEIDY